MQLKTLLGHLKLLEKHSNIMPLAAENWKNEFQTLVAIILSARTRDETTIKICKILFQKYPSAEKLAKARIRDIENIIKPVNFFRNKSKNIIACAEMLVNQYNSEVPKNIEELIKLPGVGRKTANVFLTEVGQDGIGVDTHVSYISQKLGWTKNSNPHKIEEDLKSLFPQKYWNKVNSTLVRFGKSHMSRKKKDDLLNEIRKQI